MFNATENFVHRKVWYQVVVLAQCTLLDNTYSCWLQVYQGEAVVCQVLPQGMYDRNNCYTVSYMAKLTLNVDQLITRNIMSISKYFYE